MTLQRVIIAYESHQQGVARVLLIQICTITIPFHYVNLRLSLIMVSPELKIQRISDGSFIYSANIMNSTLLNICANKFVEFTITGPTSNKAKECGEPACRCQIPAGFCAAPHERWRGV